MQIHELTLDERQVMFGLLAHLATADAAVTAGESAELAALGEEMGVESLSSTIAAARVAFRTPDDVLVAARRVDRPDARELIRTVLLDLAGADGERSEVEQALIAKLHATWGMNR